jgi:hypothetical protein
MKESEKVRKDIMTLVLRTRLEGGQGGARNDTQYENVFFPRKARRNDAASTKSTSQFTSLIASSQTSAFQSSRAFSFPLNLLIHK